MPKVTFTAQNVVYVHIQGEKQEPKPGDSLPRVRDDGDLTGRFMRWLHTSNIRQANVPSTSGGGQWIGAFYPDDYKRVREWLMNHSGGIEEVDSDDDER